MPLPSEKQVYLEAVVLISPALRICKDGRVYADQFENGTKDQCWTLVHLGNDLYNISSRGWYLQASQVLCGSRYLYTTDGEASLMYNYDCKWKIEYNRKGYVSIKSCNGK